MASRTEEHSPNDSLEDDDFNSFLSTEIALSFDHILEQILDSLDTEDLLNCRLVCRRWLFFAQKPLQNQIKLTFYQYRKRTNTTYYPMEDDICKRLPELTNLLKKGQALPDSDGNGHISIRFPCNRFEFEGVRLSNEHLQQFLETNGQNIRVLNLDTITDSNENVLMDTIGNLLLNQAPNIKDLHLYVDALQTIQWKNKNKDPFNECLQTTDPEYQEICQKALELLQSKPNHSLKVLHLGGKDLGKLLEFIIRISSRLEEIQLGLDAYSWLRYHKHLLEPENRLSLLKEFVIFLGDDAINENSSFETMEKLSFGNFRLRNFKVFLSYTTGWIQKHPDYDLRIVDMINRMLKGSWDTLGEIRFEFATFLSGMKLPEFMPKVRNIIIRDLMETSEEADANWNMTVFPIGSSFQKTFPKLRSIHLEKVIKGNNVVRSFSGFLKGLNFGADPLSTSVRRVTLWAAGRPNDDLGELSHPIISQMIQQWFPNALIHQESI